MRLFIRLNIRLIRKPLFIENNAMSWQDSNFLRF